MNRRTVNRTTVDRRTFLTLSGGAIAAGLAGSLVLPRTATARQSAPESNRTLVVVDLQGGNDALNTLVPQSGRYRDLRPTIGIAEDALLSFDGLDFGVHPSLLPLKPFWDRGNLAALYGTGIEGQGRSHFTAQEAWRTGRPGVPARSGWLGRWVEATPLADPTPLRAIALGQSTLAAQGEDGRPVAIQSVEGFQLKPPRNNSDVTVALLAMSDPSASGLFADTHTSFEETVASVTQLQELVAGIQVSDDQGIDLEGDAALFTAAQAIIQADVGTEILYVTVDGFDTHSLQGPKQDQLLQLVADGVAGLFEGLAETGHDQDTLVMVVSEFGRRCAENGSAGTDHGRGGLSFLIGPPVAGSTSVGEPDLADLIDGDLRITTDARALYDHALRWLGADDQTVVQVLGDEWNQLSLLS